MKDLTGERFGRLVVLERAGKEDKWKCRCDCGSIVIRRGSDMSRGDTRSCGCLRRELARERRSTHRHSKTRLYRVWASIKNRCYNEKVDNYKYYGGKGVKMCDEWKDSFEAFEKWAYENGYDETAGAQKCTIDRIDVLKDYEPSNCRWVNHVVQCNNQTSNVILELNGESHTMAEWARILGVKYTTLRGRIYRGMPPERALTEEVRRVRQPNR